MLRFIQAVGVSKRVGVKVLDIVFVATAFDGFESLGFEGERCQGVVTTLFEEDLLFTADLLDGDILAVGQGRDDV